MKRKLDGTFFEFRHHNTAEGKYWNSALEKFSAEQWREKVREISNVGMDYIVLMASSLYDRSYFPSEIYPLADIPCKDPIEEILSQADECGVKVFIGNGFYGDWTKPHRNITDPQVIKRSFCAMEELTALYGSHKSFYGWYLPDETCIIMRFSEDFTKYVNLCSAECKKLTPEKKLLIAPYGTNLTFTNDKFVKCLSNLDVDFIAYQDEIGVRKTPVWASEKIFERLKKAHDKAARAKLWADIEVFKFEGTVYKSALLPADFKRIERQIKNVSPYAEKILCYQYTGLMNPTSSEAFAGHESSKELYDSYIEYLNK